MEYEIKDSSRTAFDWQQLSWVRFSLLKHQLCFKFIRLLSEKIIGNFECIKNVFSMIFAGAKIIWRNLCAIILQSAWKKYTRWVEVANGKAKTNNPVKPNHSINSFSKFHYLPQYCCSRKQKFYTECSPVYTHISIRIFRRSFTQHHLWTWT